MWSTLKSSEDSAMVSNKGKSQFNFDTYSFTSNKIILQTISSSILPTIKTSNLFPSPIVQPQNQPTNVCYHFKTTPNLAQSLAKLWLSVSTRDV